MNGRILGIDRAGESREAVWEQHDTLMEALRDDGFGILASCGGYSQCGTCHVYVEQPWLGRLAKQHEEELELLDASEHREPNSRLSCQIKLSELTDGIEVRIAPEG